MTYIITYFFIFLFALSFIQNSKNIIWYFFAIYLVIFIGLRYATGGDWWNYFRDFNSIMDYLYNIKLYLYKREIGYQCLAYLCFDMFGINGFYILTFISAFIFILGLYVFLNYQPYPWIGLMVAFPYLIIVVGMGYMRQSIAFGLSLIAISFLLYKKNFKLFLFFILFATLFHKSAIILLGLGLFAEKKGKFLKFISIILIIIALWTSYLSKQTITAINSYIVNQMSSQGAYIRLTLNLIPALILFFFKEQWKKKYDDFEFWKIVAIFTFLAFFLLKLSSTVVDRISLYFIILQIVVFSRLPEFLKINVKIVIFIIFIYYFLILSVWLMFASHSYMWLPYKNIIFIDLW